MYNDADVETYAARLRSTDSKVRTLAAEEATDGISDWGQHSYTESQAHRIASALVDALSVESDLTARESILNALDALVAWDLAPVAEVSRALTLPRLATDAPDGHWEGIEEWARRNL